MTKRHTALAFVVYLSEFPLLAILLIVGYSQFMDSNEKLSILFLGDVIGKPGRTVVVEYLSQLVNKPDLIICNVENAAHGFGVVERHIEELSEAGVNVFTGGNHTFDQREIFAFIDKHDNVLRPANYPEGTPGKGFCIVEVKGVKVGILNIQGRIFMEPLDSPFMVADRLVTQLSKETKIIFVDMHAEATAEKVAMGWHLDGRISTLVGTHTHVQTADERILPGGTAYLTDAGACGPTEGVIGMDKKSVFRRMINQLPARFEVAQGPAMVNGVSLIIDANTGKALSIERLQYKQVSASAPLQK
jgi:2',3'-cyclic-nucleotide 2'-phosphodiesterase